MCKNNKLEQIKQAAVNKQPVAIYGAGIIGFNIFTALKEVYGLTADTFLVSEQKNNPKQIAGISVTEPEDWRNLHDGCILIAAPEEYHADMAGRLKCCKTDNYICIDSELEYAVMSEYYRRTERFPLLGDIAASFGREELQKAVAWKSGEKKLPEDISVMDRSKEASSDICVIMACHIKDRKLKQNYTLPEWIVPIQVGAGETKQRLGFMTDDTGLNISDRNHNYSELTATYWLWKNNNSSYKGVCHYRRYLKLTNEEAAAMTGGGVDAVLPLPFCCNPDAKAQYGRYISEADSELLFSVLRQLEPEYADAAQVLLNGPWLYNYNMLIARQEVFDGYCAWMFPILFEVEKRMTEKGVERRDRYAGYMGEVLTSLYFMKNSGRLKLAHACKIWMV